METRQLSPKQIVTLNDFLLYSVDAFKDYYTRYQEGKKVPPCPIMHESYVLPSFDSKLKKDYKEFKKRNPQAEYFLLDGSHKTTAAALTSDSVDVMLFKIDADVQEAKKMLEKGELFGLSVEDTIKEIIEELKDHFSENPGFQTVEEKADRLARKEPIKDFLNN